MSAHASQRSGNGWRRSPGKLAAPLMLPPPIRATVKSCSTNRKASPGAWSCHVCSNPGVINDSYGTVLVLDDTLGAVDRVDGLFPTGVFLGSGRQTILLIQVELEPHSESVQLPLLNDGQAEPLDLPGGESFQFLQVKHWNKNRTAKDIHKLSIKKKSILFISLYLNVVKVYVESCEGLSEGFVPPRQPAQSLCRVRLRGVIWLRAAAHWAAELPGRHQGQTAQLRHAHPGTPQSWSELRSVHTDFLDIYPSLNTQTIFHQIESDARGYLWCLRISRHWTAIAKTVAPAGMTRPVTDCSWNSFSPLFRTRNMYCNTQVDYPCCFKNSICVKLVVKSFICISIYLSRRL